MAKITLFSQVIGRLPKENIRKIIRTAGTDKHCKGYDTWSQFVSMVFCQFSQCDSVRDISNESLAQLNLRRTNDAALHQVYYRQQQQRLVRCQLPTFLVHRKVVKALHIICQIVVCH